MDGRLGLRSSGGGYWEGVPSNQQLNDSIRDLVHGGNGTPRSRVRVLVTWNHRGARKRNSLCPGRPVQMLLLGRAASFFALGGGLRPARLALAGRRASSRRAGGCAQPSSLSRADVLHHAVRGAAAGPLRSRGPTFFITPCRGLRPARLALAGRRTSSRRVGGCAQPASLSQADDPHHAVPWGRGRTVLLPGRD